MAFASTTVWELRTTGNDANGGGYSSGGLDYSQQDSPQFTYTDLVIDGTTNTKCTSAAHPFDANSPGNIINVTGGTGFTVQRVQVVSVSAGVATCDKSLGTLSSTGGAGKMGGCFASPATAASVLVTSNFVWQKSGTYTITAAGSNVSTGIVSLGALCNWQGYGTTRGDDAAAPLLQVIGDGTLTSAIVFQTAITNVVVRNISIDGQSKASIKGFVINAGSVDLVTVSNCTNDGFSNIGGLFTRCRATNITGGSGAFNCGNSGSLYFCEADANTVTGFNLQGTNTATFCIARNNTGASVDGFFLNIGKPIAVVNSISYGNGRDGVRILEASNVTGGGTVINTICEGNGGWGIGAAGAVRFALLLNNAGYNNTSGNVDTNFAGAGLAPNKNFQPLTSSPFTNAAGGDFSLNNTAGAGAACRATGITSIPSISSTGYLDIGAFQHQDPAGMIRARVFSTF